MKNIRVKVVGGGSMLDPLRVPFPNYQQVGDMSGGVWVVSIPDEDMPQTAPAPTNVAVPNVGNVPTITSMPARSAADQATILDTRYPTRDKSVSPTIQ